MTFAVSLDGGALEYAGNDISHALCAEKEPLQSSLLVDAARHQALLRRSARQHLRKWRA